ncbi:MAG: hypothetical protein DLD55_01790 [candidate division SR1 bacterium]|nr:MAG: hypothetical protein DLD55_01790 [candidate division SR1 bacterium]
MAEYLSENDRLARKSYKKGDAIYHQQYGIGIVLASSKWGLVVARFVDGDHTCYLSEVVRYGG